MTMVAVPAAAGVPYLRPLLLLLLFFNHHHLLLAVAQQQQQQQQQQAVAAGYPGGGRGWRGMSEQERAGAFRANGYEWPRTFSTQTTKGWPPQPAGPESDAYRRSRERIEAHIRGIEDYKLRWDEFFGLAQVRLMPSFTEHGFQKITAPPELFAELRDSYDRGLAKLRVQERSESFTHKPGSTTPKDLLPLFIAQDRLNDKVMRELKPIAEEWAGVRLREGQSYGVRVYKNGSTLVNHVDRSETHVISCIFHIGHDLDEPWPLEIEDHDGKVHAVNMEPGEMVLYESAKQYHARLTPMRGRHYGSLFIHYFPAEGWNWTMWDVHVAVPPDFLDTTADMMIKHGRGGGPGEPVVVQRPGDSEGPGGFSGFDGPTPLMEYYRDYWKGRGEGFVPAAWGIDEPVQSFSHPDGFVKDAADDPRRSKTHDEF